MQISVPSKIGKWSKLTTKSAVALLKSGESLFLGAFYLEAKQQALETVLNKVQLKLPTAIRNRYDQRKYWRTVARVKPTEIVFSTGSRIELTKGVCYYQAANDGLVLVVANYELNSFDELWWNYKFYFMKG